VCALVNARADTEPSTVRSLWIGPDLRRVGGAASHLRQVLAHAATPHLGFATFAPVFDPAAAPRIVAALPLAHGGWRSYPRSIIRLSRFLDRHRPLAMVAFGPQPLIVASAAAALAKRAPHLGYVEITRPRRAGAGSGRFWSRHANAFLFRRALRRVRIAAANSSDGLAELATILAPRAPDLRLLRNPVDLAAWSLPAVGAASGRPLRLLSVGRLVPSKGFADLIHAAAGLAGRISFSLAIAGSGPELPLLQRMTAELGLGDHVTFLGCLEDPRTAMRDADVFVFPSLYEGFPNAVLEAMAAGRPVVSSLWGTDARQLHDTGVVRGYEPGDVAGLIAALGAVLESPDIRAELVARGRRFVTPFAAAEVVADYDALFRDLGGSAP
jgi:glycosyltransferase involved in cell wall biosynthesis